ncbi:sensor histidine kinase [Agromyces sp. MMS24-K17]|uniref:sensor histidine kinase n=1 Tax=Agromyces sp. MMS24-K17 TaxID=3372850 RepID=UPI0037547334
MTRPSPKAVLALSALACLLVQAPWTAIDAARLGLDPLIAGLDLALAVAGPALLLLAIHRPGPVVAALSAFALADVLLTPVSGPPYVALLVGIGVAVRYGALVWTAVSVGLAWLTAIVVGTIEGLAWHPFRVAVATAALAAAVAVGWLVRVRLGRAELLRAEVLRRRAVAERGERRRIARGLQDSLAQVLAQVHVQASVGVQLMERDPERGRAALERVRDLAAAALEEVRSVVGVLAEDDAPRTPAKAELDQLPRLVAGARTHGLDARLDDRLHGAPARAAQFAAYRIAEEALENVVRHAEASVVEVVVVRDGDALVLTVDDDGQGIHDDAEVGGGVLSMRERATLIGGGLDVGESELGGTRVAARLPWAAIA